jgi:hypothetical protein
MKPSHNDRQIAITRIMASTSFLPIDGLALSTLPSTDDRLIILELNLSYDVMRLGRLIT